MRRFPLLYIIGMVLVSEHLGAAVTSQELKGTMIQRIATFIEWPVCPKDTLSVGVYDDQRSVEKFKKVFASQSIGGREVIVKGYSTIADISGLSSCDILYLGNASISDRDKILDKTAKKGILLIGSTRDDAKAGVSIVLLEEMNRYKILINMEAVKNSNLKADYRLLRLAEIIEAKQ